VLVVGFGRKLTDFINAVRKNFNWGLDIIGVVIDDSGNGTKEIAGKKVLGKYSQIEEILKIYNPEEVIIAIPSDHLYKIKQIIYHCEKAGMNVRLVSDFFYYLEKRVTIDNVFGQNIISFQGVNQNQLELFIKRLIDIVVSFVLLVLLLPLFLVISLIILFQDGRPIFYRWKVMGKNRKPITSWKFRTMVKNADEIKEKLKKANEMQGPVFKLTHDPRILPFGRFLRRYSLDELPQLFSVLKGDLSLVGPRPPLQSEFKEFELWHRRKLSVKPGLTCLWQVSGRNSIKNFDDWARLDLEYIDNWNLWLDFKILLKTIPAVIKGTGK
jgi:exopolysaccharide biosynthesis polyprenyl glycosylphosphotransferase